MDAHDRRTLAVPDVVIDVGLVARHDVAGELAVLIDAAGSRLARRLLRARRTRGVLRLGLGVHRRLNVSRLASRLTLWRLRRGHTLALALLRRARTPRTTTRSTGTAARSSTEVVVIAHSPSVASGQLLSLQIDQKP